MRPSASNTQTTAPAVINDLTGAGRPATAERRVTVETPIGELVLVARGGRLAAIRLPGRRVPLPRTPKRPAMLPSVPPLDTPARRASSSAGPGAVDSAATEDDAVLAAAERQLGEYFAGLRREFDLPLDVCGTPFQRDVWGALARIGYGTTVSYSHVADEIGRAGAARAVGAAVGANPLPIVVPCHRVVGADGRLTGYGSGLPRKRYLLALEQSRRL